jgi:hypothetical protein
LSEASGTIHWDTAAAANGTWTPLGSLPTSSAGFDLSHGGLRFSAHEFHTGNAAPGTATFANLNVTPAPIATLRDPFLSVDTNNWFVVQATAGSTVSASNGVLSLAPEAGNPNGDATLIGYSTYSLTGSSFSIKVPQTVAGNGSVNQTLRLAPGPFAWDRSLGFWYESGNLYAYTEVDETPTAVATLTYSPVTHAYWRVRDTAGTVFWETSPDGVTWTIQGSVPESSLSFSPGALSVFLTTNEFSTGNPAPGVGKFSNLNQ